MIASSRNSITFFPGSNRVAYHSCIRYAVAATYTGVKQNGMPNASGTGNPLSNSGAVNPFQATTNVSGINAWTVLIGVPSQSGTATAGSGATIRRQQPGALVYADSNGPVSGSSSLSWSMPSATAWLANYFSLPPLGSDPGSTSTTTYTYDKNGNLTQSTTGTTTTTYTYDYLNRLISLRTGTSATTTYAYDWQGNRVSQTTGNTTTLYPSKFYTVTSTQNGATTHATSTLYAYANDLLLATIDTPSTTVGTTTTTGTSTTHYIHPDNLGSTQATSDAQGNLSQYFLYNPYGSVLTSTSTDPTANIKRQYIGQYTDTSGLSYLNARYYASERGQFLSQDPLFLGDSAQQNLQDPQSLNAYAYSEDNPIAKSDPTGKSSIASLLGDPFGSAQFLGSLGIGVAYAEYRGLPATAELLGHSLSLNPGPIYAGNGSVLVNSITSNPQYQAQLQAVLQNANSKGLTSINQTLPLEFNQGDAYTAFHKIDLNLNGSRDKSGIWQLSVSGSDVYDFDYNNYGGNKFVGSANNLAYFGQGQGTVTNFTTYLNFTQSIKSGFSSGQSSAIAGLAQSFGVSSLSSAQISAIQAVKSAFSK